jgi:hypothetical protein
MDAENPKVPWVRPPGVILVKADDPAICDLEGLSTEDSELLPQRKLDSRCRASPTLAADVR